MVYAVSQPPVVLATVSLNVPALLYCTPLNTYGNCAWHNDVSMVACKSWLTARVMVYAVSQPPVVEATVSLKVPALLYCTPLNTYGNCAWQSDVSIVACNSWLMARVIVSAVSQPPVVLATVSLKVPALVY